MDSNSYSLHPHNNNNSTKINRHVAIASINHSLTNSTRPLATALALSNNIKTRFTFNKSRLFDHRPRPPSQPLYLSQIVHIKDSSSNRYSDKVRLGWPQQTTLKQNIWCFYYTVSEKISTRQLISENK